MELTELSDKTVFPTDEIIFSIIGDNALLWKQTFSYLNDHSKDITSEWRYYNDGKSWLLKTAKKKKTLFWIRVIDGSFRMGFWFAEKHEKDLMESNLPENLKNEFKNGKSFNKIRSISIFMTDSKDVENAKKLIDLKLKLN